MEDIIVLSIFYIEDFSPVAYVSSSFCFSLLTRDTVLTFRLVQYGGCPCLITTNFLAFASSVDICFLLGQLSFKPPVSFGCLWKRTVLSGRLLLSQRYGCLYWLHLIVNICTMNGIQVMYLMFFFSRKKLAIEEFCLQCELKIFNSAYICVLWYPDWPLSRSEKQKQFHLILGLIGTIYQGHP